MLLIRLGATDFARITRSILQTATVALIIIQISSVRPAHLLRPTRLRTVIVSHVHSRKARTVHFSERKMSLSTILRDYLHSYLVILRVRTPQTRSTVYGLTSLILSGFLMDLMFCGV